jgi:hypothetical protein
MLKTGSNYTMSTNPALEKIEESKQNVSSNNFAVRGKSEWLSCHFFSALESSERPQQLLGRRR